MIEKEVSTRSVEKTHADRSSKTASESVRFRRAWIMDRSSISRYCLVPKSATYVVVGLWCL